MLAAILTCVLVAPSPRYKIGIGVLKYIQNGPSITVLVGITNTGDSTIRYNQANISEARGRTETQRGWSTVNNSPTSLLPGTPTLLAPGSWHIDLVALDRDMLRWQITYKIRSASLRDRVFVRFPAKSRTYARPILRRVLPGKEGPEKEVQSEVFERPRNVKRNAE